MIKFEPKTGVFFCMPLFYIVPFFMILVMGASSCVSPKNSFFFRSLPRDTVFTSTPQASFESKIRKTDLLSINISSLNREEDIMYNSAAGGAGPVATAGSVASGYQLDANGNIQVHRLGPVHAEGMTRRELKEKLQKDLTPFLKDPIVSIRYLNRKVTVLGEVQKPSVVPMPEEQLSLLEVLGSSGDVSTFARRDNILVIRDTGSGKELKRINLEDRSIFTSEWYYLKPDDVVYVEPNDKKVNEEKRNRKQQTISIVLAAASLAIIILNRIFP